MKIPIITGMRDISHELKIVSSYVENIGEAGKRRFETSL
jgi:hypothetical protein